MEHSRPIHSFEFEATGTTWVIDVADQGGFESIASLEASVKERVAGFERKYSRFLPGSMVAKMAKSAGKFEVEDEIRPMIDLYFDLERITGGLFTPLIGSTLNEAGYDKDYSFTQSPFSPIFRLDEVCKYDFPILKTSTPLQFDFGAIGKGMVIDTVADLLMESGIKTFCIDAGRDIKRFSIDGTEINISLEHPNDSELAIGVYKLGAGSLCGSSGNQRKWKKFHHIFNPTTHESTEAVVAVWVANKSAMLADGLSTALFLVQPEILVDEYDFEFVVVYRDMSMRKSDTGRFELFV